MEINQNTYEENGNRQAALVALAGVGFVVLICFGIYLAVYAARFVPSVVTRLDTAAVELFSSGPNNSLAVIPASTASTTIPFGDGTTTTPVATTTTPAPVTPKPAPVTPTAGTPTSGTYPIGGTAPATYYGLPDLAVTVTAVGYLTSNTADSFVAATVVPHGFRPAIKFTIKNVGTNTAGQWRFSAVIPTATAFVYQSPYQQALNPGESIDYTLGFDQALMGPNEQITLSANFDHAIAESNTSNNNVFASVTVQ
jgi:hypothetical protein